MFQHLGMNLRRLRSERRLTQSALARRIRPSRRQTEISDLELGRIPASESLTNDLLQRLAVALDVTTGELLRGPQPVRRAVRSATSTAKRNGVVR